MAKIDGFQTTDSFRFDRDTSSSSISLSSSSGYGSRLSLSPTDSSSSSSNRRRLAIRNYFKEKLSRHKSLTSLLFLSSSRTAIDDHNNEIYDTVWNLDEQIEKFRRNIPIQPPSPPAFDCQSVISMSVDTPSQQTADQQHRIDDYDLLSAAAWYQEGLTEIICEEYLRSNEQPIGSFLIRRNFIPGNALFILSIKTSRTSIEHHSIQRSMHDDAYQIEGSTKRFINLSALVIHHTVMRETLPVTLVLPHVHSTLNTPRRTFVGHIRSVRF